MRKGAADHGRVILSSAIVLPALLRMLLIENPVGFPAGFSFSVVVAVIIHTFIHNVNDDSVDSEKFCDRW